MTLPYRVRKLLVDFSYPILVNTGLLRTINYFGIKVPLSIPILTTEIRKAFLLGTYEDKECETISSLIEPNEVVLEIGVGLGIISTLILKNTKVLKYKGYEGNPELLPWIKKIFELNQVEHQIENALLVVNPTSSKLPFYLRENFWASSMDFSVWGYTSTVDVALQDFEELIKSYQPSLIVCDIEGGEYDLLTKSKLGAVTKIYLEVHPKVLGEKKVQHLFEELKKSGFIRDQRFSSGDVHFFKKKA